MNRWSRIAAAPAAALIALGAAGCGASGSSGAADVASAQPSATSVTRASDSLGARAAADACRTWALGNTQSSHDESVTDRTAAGQVDRAAHLDPAWSKLASEMDFIAALPETGVAAADRATAASDLADIVAECAGLGVTVH